MAKQESVCDVYNKLVEELETLQESSYDNVRELLSYQAEIPGVSWEMVGNLIFLKNKLNEINKFTEDQIEKYKSKEELEDKSSIG